MFPQFYGKTVVKQLLQNGGVVDTLLQGNDLTIIDGTALAFRVFFLETIPMQRK
jgi:hypothetical protein